jgi:SAM-dependent MidA family methyltransferase
MTALTDLLLKRIRAEGPLTVADYMGTCLLHPEHGYYATRDPFGQAGDFITAPEISQMFGELVGLSLAQAWLDQGAPGRIALAELGPGRGTLMADALRATARVPGFHAALRVHLIEASPTLRAVQRRTLGNVDVQWHDDVSTLPEMPLFAIANEFFDALPIRQFQRGDTGWRERLIGAEGDRLTFGLGPETRLEALEHRLADTDPGDLVETCPAAAGIIATLGQRIADHGGAALIVDYGDWRSLGDTLQALHRHQPVDALQHCGNADLTAHVDFEALAHAAPCKFSRLTPQGVFLERLSITARAQALAGQLTGKPLETHIAAHRRLTHPAEMGTLFKVMALYPEGHRPPPGCEP